MPLTYPLALSDFQDLTNIEVGEFFLSNPRQIDRTAEGTQLTASLGDAVWEGSIRFTVTTDRTVAARNDALLSVLDRAGSSFLVYDPFKPNPASGGTPTATISGLDGSDARLMSLSGLPASYQLKAGDLLSFTYGSSPTRYALHRIVSDVLADGTGATALFEVTPFIQPAVTTGASVTFNKPVMKAVLRPNPSYGTNQGLSASGKSFSFVQTLR